MFWFVVFCRNIFHIDSLIWLNHMQEKHLHYKLRPPGWVDDMNNPFIKPFSALSKLHAENSDNSSDIYIFFLPHFSGVLPMTVPFSEFQTKFPKSSHRCPQVLFSFRVAMMKFFADHDDHGRPFISFAQLWLFLISFLTSLKHQWLYFSVLSLLSPLQGFKILIVLH